MKLQNIKLKNIAIVANLFLLLHEEDASNSVNMAKVYDRVLKAQKKLGVNHG